MERLLDISELAEKMHVKVSTLYAWTHKNYIPHYKIGRLVRFSEEEVSSWLNNKTVKGRKKRVPEINLESI